MKKLLVIALASVIGFSAQAAKVEEKKALVCITAYEKVYGVAMTRYTTASTDIWRGTAFSLEDLRSYQATGSFEGLGVIVDTNYDGVRPEMTVTDGKTSMNLYSCKTLTFWDRISGEKEFYEMLTDYQY